MRSESGLWRTFQSYFIVNRNEVGGRSERPVAVVRLMRLAPPLFELAERINSDVCIFMVPVALTPHQTGVWES